MDGNGRGDVAWAEAAAALERFLATAREGRAGAVPAEDASPLDPLDFLAEAALSALAAGSRSWLNLALLCVEHPALASALSARPADLSPSERRLMSEELRGLVREVGDMASREARRLQADLEALALRLDPGSGAAAPRRYARIKP